MTVLAVAAVVFAVFALQSRPSAGGGPAASASAQQGAAASGPASPSPSATPESSASSSPSLSPSAAAPKVRITGLTSTAIAGSTKRRLTLTWTLSDTQSGIRSELLQRRTDSGSWVTVALSSLSVRSASFSMPRGHLYGFRIRATDRSGNVGLFVSRSIRI
jgi:hypothetical protein